MLMSRDNLASIAETLYERLSKVTDACAILVSHSVERQVRFANNIITIVKTWLEGRVSVCADKDRRTVVFDVPLELAIRAPERVIDHAVRMLKHAPPREDYAPFPEPATRYPTVEHFDRDVLERPERGPEIVQKVIEDVLSEGVRRVAGTLRMDASREFLLTSTGARLFDEGTSCYLDVRTFMDKEETGAFATASSHISGLDVRSVVTIASYLAKASRDVKVLEPGQYDTLFSPLAWGSLLNWVAMAASAYAVLLGFSFFAGKLGQKVASDIITLIDNPLAPRTLHASPWDLEGTPTRANTIIESGVLRTYLHNRFTAKRMKAELTGNAGWIFPTAWQVECSAGERSWESMLSDMKRGLIVGNCTYVRMQNYVTSEFSCVIRDGVYYVENGEVKFRVRGLRLADRLLNILSNVAELSRERYQIFSWWFEENVPCIAPWAFVRGVKYSRAFGY